jgi:hypothetical protein
MLKFSQCPRIFVALPLFFWTLSCGSTSRVEKFKNYRLSLVETNATLEPEFRKLIKDFNKLAGSEVLIYAPSIQEANSAIVITSGLKAQTDGKIGLGQWLAESQTTDPGFDFGASVSKQKIYYSMRLEFDKEYFMTRLEVTESNEYDKQKLFFHEVGHGLEMDHNYKDVGDLMYPDITGSKNFNFFFNSVRQYMAD